MEEQSLPTLDHNSTQTRYTSGLGCPWPDRDIPPRKETCFPWVTAYKTAIFVWLYFIYAKAQPQRCDALKRTRWSSILFAPNTHSSPVLGNTQSQAPTPPPHHTSPDGCNHFGLNLAFSFARTNPPTIAPDPAAPCALFYGSKSFTFTLSRCENHNFRSRPIAQTRRQFHLHTSNLFFLFFGSRARIVKNALTFLTVTVSKLTFAVQVLFTFWDCIFHLYKVLH